MHLGWHYIWGLGIRQWIEKQLVIIVVMIIIDSDQRLKDPYMHCPKLTVKSDLGYWKLLLKLYFRLAATLCTLPYQ